MLKDEEAERAFLAQIAAINRQQEKDFAAYYGNGPAITFHCRCGANYRVEAGWPISHQRTEGPSGALFCGQCAAPLNIPEPIKELQRGVAR